MTDTTAPVAGQGATPVEPSSTPAPINSSAAPGTTASSTPSEWTAGLNEDVLGYVNNKGWKTPADVVDGYRNLEKLRGVPADRLLKLPDFNTADKVELDQYYSKLGRPMDASKYQLDMPEGSDEGFANWAKSSFYDEGLSDKQAMGLSKRWNEYVAQTQQQQQEQMAAASRQQDANLRSEWGQAYEQEIGVAKHAAKALGMSAEMIDKLQNSLGYDGVMKLMNNIGKRIGEDKFASGEASGGGAMTPAGAKARIQQLQQDREWTNKYLAGNVQARAEMERLMQFAYPG